VHRRQPEVRRDLAEAHGPHAAVGVAPHLVGRQRRVPQRDERERDEPPAAGTAPLVDHPVVVGLDAQQGEVLVAGFEERLAAEAREAREAQRGLDVVYVHVREPGLRLPAPAPHLVVGDGDDLHLVAGEAGRGRQSGLGDLLVLVDPPVAQRTVVGRLVREHAADEGHVASPLHHPRARVAVLGGQPRLPHVGRLDHVVVHRDDARQVVDGHRRRW
jgi:hypothetical protein